MAPDRRNYLGGLCSLLTLLCSLVLTQAAPQDVPSAASFYVDSIPGITQDPNNPLKIFAGHLSADPDFPKAKATDVTSHVYFVMIKNRRLADKRRVMFWFNGGPGCSSFDGLMMEVGPWRMDGKGGFKVQEGGWEEYMTMVYVDQPAGTGFSYTSTDKYVHTVKEIQDQFMEFLRNFYLVFPEYKNEDTYLGGESFAGQWIPYFADAILGSNMHIPLKGVAIGNGWIDPRRQYATYIDFAVKVGLIEENSNAWKVARKQTDECVAVMNKEKGKEPMQWHGCEGLVQAVVVSKNHKKDDKNMCLNIYDVRLEDTSPACGMNWPPDMKPITDFLGHKDVVRAIHAEAHSEAWIECRRDVHRAFHEKTENASITIVPKVLEKIPILIFAGDQDLICNYVGLEAMIKEMSWNGATGLGTVETQNWSVNNTAAGTWVTSRNLTYAKIFNASHMVPYDVPFVAHDMIQRFAGFNFSAINSGTALIPSSLGTKKKPVFVGQADAKPTTLPNAGKTPEQDKAMWEAYYNAGSAALVLLVIFTAIGSFVWCRHRRRPVQLPVRQNDDESIPLRPTDQDEEDEELEGMRQQKGKMRARDPSNPPIFDVGDDEDDVPHKHGGHRRIAVASCTVYCGEKRLPHLDNTYVHPTMAMEPSTSQLPAPDTAARMAIRQRPQIRVAPHGPLSQPTWVQFWHPANNLIFLRLPALDWCPPTFGIHYGTAVTACQILACNENGYLSTSRDRHARGRINVDLDSIITPGIYYYHLSSQKSEALYPICCDFPCWKFPHTKLPPAWENELPNQMTGVWPSNWTAISERIKTRDTQCLISESQDCLTTSHVVPRINEKWARKMLVFDLVQNKMHVYLNGDQHSLTNNSSNLFTLRWDLQLGLFDQAGFAIVPKLGQLVVHFLQPTNQSAQLYHNVQFDHKNTLSHEALYARFAWALMKIVKSSTVADMEEFRFLTASDTDGGGDDSGRDEDGGGDEGSSAGEGGSGGGDEGGRRSGGGGRGRRGSGRNKGSGRSRGGVKRKREDENEDDESHYCIDTTSDPGSDWRSGNHVTPDACPREDGSQLLLDSEAREFEEDMKTAAHTLPFFVDPNVKASARYYENITWYPGRAIVDRRKQAYFDAHPQIRAHSSPLLPDDYNSSDENLV